MSRRTDRVSDLVRAELFEILRRDVNDPRVNLASITEVQVSPDLKHARVWVSVLGEEAQREEAFAALQKAKGFIRRQLGRRLNLKTTPDPVFELDHRAEISQQMSELLEELNDEHESS